MDGLDSNGGPADIAEIEQIVKEKMVRFESKHVVCMDYVQSYLFFSVIFLLKFVYSFIVFSLTELIKEM